MKKRVFLGKFLIHLVLLAGIVLSVIAYFYTEYQTKMKWQDSQLVSLDLAVSDLEKDFYISLLDVKSKLIMHDHSEDIPLSDSKYFTNWTAFQTSNLNVKKDIYSIDFNLAEDKTVKLEITNKQIKNILANSIGYGYYFFTLDGESLYVAFVDAAHANIDKIYMAKVKPFFDNIVEYDGYIINVFNEDSQVIYNQSSYIKKKQEEYFELRKSYENANVEFQITVFVNPKGLDGFGGYSILFMGAILFITFAIVTYLFRQNLALNDINSKMIMQSRSLKSAYDLFKKITGNAFDIISVIDSNLKVEYANSAYAKVLNYNPTKIQGVMFYDLLPEVEKDKFIRKLKSFDYNKGSLNFEFEMLHSNKQDKIVVESMIHPVFDEFKQITNYIVHCKDITAKRESLKALLQSKRRFKDFADSSADWLWETDEKLRFSFVSSGIRQSTGFEVDDLINKKIETLFYKSNLVIDKLNNDRGPLKDIEIKIKSKAKEDIWLRISAIPVYSEVKGFIGYRGVGRNITFIKKDQERVIELATKDYLTGLLNRSAFMHELNNTLNLAKRNGTQGALLFIDLDMFKMVNESHGHEAGDKVLREISLQLKASLRNTDVVARIGGDEFAVLMHDINPKEARKKISELINKLSRLKVNYNGEEIQTTCSIGVVKYPSEDQDASHVMTAAGLAMHKAKDMGRNRVYMTDDNFFEDSFAASAKQKMKWLNILRGALDNETFEMHFQPMMPKSKNDVVIFESLLRIRDENNNLGSPVYFIEAAENFGLAQTLDVSVIKRCIQHHKHLLEQNKNCMLSINISGLSLGDEVVLQALKDIVKQEKPDTNKIIIEVTETAAMRDENQAKRFVSELHALGFKFALDDFGSGYSSFYYLKNLDVDYIKIDGEFIKNLETSKEDRHFVKALADLAKGLGVKIIAEFVENQTHVNILKELNIDYMQGYHVSKPIDNLDKAVANFDEKTIDDI